jgi:ubiquinone biosynthesis monooxygenase Coq7
MDAVIVALDSALRTLFAPPRASRPSPALGLPPTQLEARAQREAAALMRVNHVGEVCAQALYTAQALATRDPQLRRHFEHAARDESDHLAWTHQRLQDMGGRPSWLNPLWYAGAFGLGLVAGRLGDPVSLGFVVESHLDRLPAEDHASRAIVAQMKSDEAAHAAQAVAAGAVPLPAPVKGLMRAAARVMTTTAHHL